MDGTDRFVTGLYKVKECYSGGKGKRRWKRRKGFDGQGDRWFESRIWRGCFAGGGVVGVCNVVMRLRVRVLFIGTFAVSLALGAFIATTVL